ncbi:MAG TPA: NYN domain-containing protein [Clostridiales bacterium]|nr:MAG: hypothetical protein A2X42_04105 [Candidatus Margulisbacteria bacterium GWF2_38_17]OGI07168.1 MAG: hypothetical protein A2X41_06175 [Candidatus Margulisbacteria bacterium GWE2_39_32]HAN20132.1 NYN domain-containing protein [Clostridiales bacterium]HCT84717.1 NYN domain-containing protein [Candidatus Margulisiibacteriota bacterium]
MTRVIAYIDGFNLYYGLKSAGLRKCYWLNPKLLIENLKLPTQTIVKVKYFTARVSKPQEKHIRQKTYLEALETIPDLEIIYGHYLMKKITCRYCSKIFDMPEEKMTDVNMGLEMLSDCVKDNYDVAFLVTADSDLVNAIDHIKAINSLKKIYTFFPPKRKSFQLRNRSDQCFDIFESKIHKSLLPTNLISKSGYPIICPASWL